MRVRGRPVGFWRLVAAWVLGLTALAPQSHAQELPEGQPDKFEGKPAVRFTVRGSSRMRGWSRWVFQDESKGEPALVFPCGLTRLAVGSSRISFAGSRITGRRKDLSSDVGREEVTATTRGEYSLVVRLSSARWKKPFDMWLVLERDGQLTVFPDNVLMRGEEEEFRAFNSPYVRLILLAINDFTAAVEWFEAAARTTFDIPLTETQAAAVLNAEQAAAAAEQSGNLREALKIYQTSLQSLPKHPPASVENELRRRAIAIVLRLDPRPAIPEEANRRAAYALAALQEAKSVEGLLRAATEWDQALRLAPWWPEGYYNSGLVLEKAGNFPAAARRLKLYLLANPQAEDAAVVQQKVYQLEFKSQQPQ